MKKIVKNIIIGILIIALSVIVTFILRGTFFNFDKKLSTKTKNEIETYIHNLDVPSSDNSMTFLSTYYFGDRFNDDKLEVYLWVIFEEYIDKDGTLEKLSATSMPYVVIIDTTNDEYKIIDYKVPKDGNKYKTSIKEMFPITIREKVLSFEKSKNYKKLYQEHQKLIDIYEEYNKED